MSNPSDLEARVTALEGRVDVVEEDARIVRQFGAKHDRDIARLDVKVDDLGVKVDANRVAINALGVQTAARFDALENEMRTGFATMRATLDQTAAGQQQIVDLLTGRIEREGEH